MSTMFLILFSPPPHHQYPKIYGGDAEGGDDGDGDYTGANVFDSFDLDIWIG